MIVWLVGDVGEEPQWGVVGIFDSEEKAIEACNGEATRFVGGIGLNYNTDKGLHEGTVVWPSAYYPFAKEDE